MTTTGTYYHWDFNGQTKWPPLALIITGILMGYLQHHIIFPQTDFALDLDQPPALLFSKNGVFLKLRLNKIYRLQYFSIKWIQLLDTTLAGSEQAREAIAKRSARTPLVSVGSFAKRSEVEAQGNGYEPTFSKNGKLYDFSQLKVCLNIHISLT